MTEKLSSRFFGNKRFFKEHFQMVAALPQSRNLLKAVFKDELSQYQQINPQLPELFLDFLATNTDFVLGEEFEFQKASTFLQLSVHLFTWSFANQKTKEQSFDQFSNLVIRHSLFRPPHSVNIFTQNDVRQITRFWIQTFDRYYPLYQHCFATKKNYVIEQGGSTQSTFDGKQIKAGKVCANKQEVLRKLHYLTNSKEQSSA